MFKQAKMAVRLLLFGLLVLHMSMLLVEADLDSHTVRMAATGKELLGPRIVYVDSLF
tara:strand:- start:426 stop:596 length:171 start_codon:yes stop_codon:yes gene_type:complete